MENLTEPDKIIEIDLPSVAKSGLWITVWTLIGLLIVEGLIHQGASFTFSIMNILYFIGGYVVLIILHELFHLLGFRVFGKVPWRSMVVGMNLKLGIAYATTDRLMTNRAIQKALLLPFWTTGVVPAVIGLVTGNGIWLTLAAFLIGGAAGDFAMYKELRKLPDDWLVKDDPQQPKLYLFEPGRVIQ
ncbi:DUF3267 domain-containing protein [Sporosarcina sp. ACRSL]|uniref:DUF3267 domain-containing protein n=1 Tax=Sporosarcina sp. ACRSL TaxID=2918215 RepID=UPI001EF71D38|nr:DUF3267 domain-containing protein [Sporosarcina sp. ACRSL]MCG7345798.1 DUF3267 domain-containing protein [Sporosarcina sp. ACRSL]